MSNLEKSTQKRQAVSIVIPTYNGRKLLEKHLPAVLKAMRAGDELVIVDDASNDDTIEWLRQEFALKRSSVPKPLTSHTEMEYWPKLSDKTAELYTSSISKNSAQGNVTVIVLRENQRFAAAANIGVVTAAHSYVFLLNNDVSPDSEVLEHLIDHFTDKQVFAVGCLEYEGASKSQSSRMSGKNRLWFEQGLYQHSGVPEHELTAGETAWVSGGSGMFDREKWLSLGGFDHRFYPAYWEDVDLSFRARKAGWKILFEPNAVVFHQHETTNSTEFGKRNIQVTSWHHADMFTWIHGTIWQRISFLLWQSVWLWRRR